MPRFDLTKRHRVTGKSVVGSTAAVSQKSLTRSIVVSTEINLDLVCFPSCAETYFLTRRFHFASKRGIQQ